MKDKSLKRVSNSAETEKSSTVSKRYLIFFRSVCEFFAILREYFLVLERNREECLIFFLNYLLVLKLYFLHCRTLALLYCTA